MRPVRRAPVKRPTTHYFFRLSSFAGPLSDWLDSSPNLQKDVKNYVRSWIKSGLEDWDITRDIPWGVPIPLEEAAGKVLYGWFDNHLAYISTALKFWRRGEWTAKNSGTRLTFTTLSVRI